MLHDRNDLLRQRQRLLGDALTGRLSRRQILQRGAALGLTATALGGLLGDARRAAAQTPTASGHVVSWAPAGQRWELAQKAVYPLFQQKFPEITVEWIAEPEADYTPRTVIEMSAKSDKYDIMQCDYIVVPQLIALGSLEPLQPYLEQGHRLHDRHPGRRPRERHGSLPGQTGRRRWHPLRSAARQQLPAPVLPQGRAGEGGLQGAGRHLGRRHRHRQGPRRERHQADRHHPQARALRRHRLRYHPPFLWRRLVRQDGAGSLQSDPQLRRRQERPAGPRST